MPQAYTATPKGESVPGTAQARPQILRSSWPLTPVPIGPHAHTESEALGHAAAPPQLQDPRALPPPGGPGTAGSLASLTATPGTAGGLGLGGRGQAGPVGHPGGGGGGGGAWRVV